MVQNTIQLSYHNLIIKEKLSTYIKLISFSWHLGFQIKQGLFLPNRIKILFYEVHRGLFHHFLIYIWQYYRIWNSFFFWYMWHVIYVWFLIIIVWSIWYIFVFKCSQERIFGFVFRTFGSASFSLSWISWFSVLKSLKCGIMITVILWRIHKCPMLTDLLYLLDQYFVRGT